MTVHVTFEVSPAKGRPELLVGRARFVNAGEETISFLPTQVESPSLALEIVDSQGRLVSLPPPPIPDPSARPFKLAPGASYEATYAGLLPSWTEAGRYRGRARLAGATGQGGAAHSDWSDITVVS
jgi:hypothetical protein